MKTNKITAAAVKHCRTGRIFTDSCHAFAYLAADDSIGGTEEPDCFCEGFLTAAGQFVDRLIAYEMAGSSGQLCFESERQELISENYI